MTSLERCKAFGVANIQWHGLHAGAQQLYKGSERNSLFRLIFLLLLLFFL